MTSSLTYDQIRLLLCLDAPPSGRDQGKWYPGCGWVWGNAPGTIRVLESLRELHLVAFDTVWALQQGLPQYRTYHLTAAGEAAVQTLKSINPQEP